MTLNALNVVQFLQSFVLSLRCQWKFIFTFQGVVFVYVSYDMVTEGQITWIDYPFSPLLPKNYT